MRFAHLPHVVGIAAAGLVALAPVLSPSSDAAAQSTQIVSVSSTGMQGDDITGRFAGPAISGNGRVVAFESMASTLVPGDTNFEVDVFVRDRDKMTTERVSVSSAGIEGNDRSTRPALDGDGNHIVFDSSADNLIAGDINGAIDVFVHNRAARSTQRVSVTSEEAEGNGNSYGPSISADGRFVCFVSLASNLVADDTNGAEDIFVRDLVDGTTERVSVGTVGDQANAASTLASISADGRWIAFVSFASNLVPDDANDERDIFLHDRETGLTERVSVSDDEQQANASSSGPSVSADGNFVAFSSRATNLVTDDTNGFTDIFVRDRAAKTTERVSVSSEETQADGVSEDPGVRGFTASGPQITPDGRYVVFFSTATNLVAGDTNTCGAFLSPPGRCPDVFVRDRVAGTTARISVSSNGTEANDRSADPAISASGKSVVFFSVADNLVAGDVNLCSGFPNCPDVFVHDVLPAAVPEAEQEQTSAEASGKAHLTKN